MAVQTMSTEWPSWAKALFAAQIVLTLAVVLPWVLMWSSYMGMGMGQMQQMMDSMRQMPIGR